MLDDTADRLHLPQRRNVRLDTLMRLRWLAIIGQTTAVLVVYFGLEFPLPIWACLAVIALSAWLNIALRIRFSLTQRLEPERAAWLLAFDIAAARGAAVPDRRAENPFAFLFLGPVLLSATALPPRITHRRSACSRWCARPCWCSCTIRCRGTPDDPLELPWIYLLGVWLSILLAIGFIGVYAWQVTEESRQLADALAATELVLAREQHLSQLDGLAAAAAHELGTPLSTISVIAKELERAIEPDSPHADDIELLREQAQRCRDILAKLTELLDRRAVRPHAAAGADRGGGRAAPQLRHRDRRRPAAGRAPPMGARNPAILYGLGNLLENAVDFAHDRVEITARLERRGRRRHHQRRRAGLRAGVMDRIGEPYVRSSKRRRMNAGGETTGLGLGFFIAKTLLERSGATLISKTAAFPDRGAVVRVRWARSDFERLRSARRPLE